MKMLLIAAILAVASLVPAQAGSLKNYTHVATYCYTSCQYVWGMRQCNRTCY